jgi:malate dehydrogenase (oxaloacetate-decarboxylating)(NADP+)
MRVQAFKSAWCTRDKRWLARTSQQALELVRRHPELEIDGEMQPEMALDAERRHQYYSFSRLARSANVLLFGSLAAANAA